jgi:hypothetical protein
MANVSRRELVVKGPTYYSEGDENAFFDWLNAISCVGRVTGHLRNLHIELRKPATIRDLTELDALLRRYRMSVAPLADLKNARNARWFANMQK